MAFCLSGRAEQCRRPRLRGCRADVPSSLSYGTSHPVTASQPSPGGHSAPSPRICPCPGSRLCIPPQRSGRRVLCRILRVSGPEGIARPPAPASAGHGTTAALWARLENRGHGFSFPEPSISRSPGLVKRHLPSRSFLPVPAITVASRPSSIHTWTTFAVSWLPGLMTQVPV